MTDVAESRRMLGARLREIRNDAHLIGRELATAAGWHWSKVSRIEHGKQTPSENDIITWCRVCRAESLVADLIATLRNLNAAYFEWKQLRYGGVRRRQQQTADIEARTRLVRGYDPDIIPGLLQTRNYAHAVLATCIDFLGMPAGELDAATDIRIERQHVLRHGVHTFSFLIAERALYAQVGTRTVMVEQLHHLLEVMDNPRVHIGVIPHEAAFLFPITGFLMYDREQAHIETLTAELTITQPRELALYDRAFNALTEQSLIGKHARQAITNAVNHQNRI